MSKAFDFCAYCETVDGRSDLESVISDLISGQYDNPVRSVAFNTAWGSLRADPLAHPAMKNKSGASRACETPASFG